MSSAADSTVLIAAGHRAAREGRFAEAARYFSEVLRHDPQNGEALYTLGFLALQQGNPAQARDHLVKAGAARPRDPLTRMTLAVALRDLGDADGELGALVEALSIDPYFLPALLSAGAWYERNGKPRTAAVTYRNALKIVPDELSWPPELRAHLEHARNFRDRHIEQMHRHIETSVQDIRGRHPAEDMARVDESFSIMAGRTKPYVQDAATLLVPRLPAIPFYDRKDFAFLQALESQAGDIRTELLDGLRGMEGFAPYVRYAPGIPVNQWAELNYSDKWSSLFLWRHGLPVEENQRRFPKTAAALAALPMADLKGFCPTAMFSALKPGARIPPHTGETNARLVVHLPLVVPEKCSYRVGYEWRKWVEGECLIFDDTIEHEARNDSDEMRIVLIFDIWNPYLTQAEREIVSAAMNAARDYYAEA